MSSKNALFYMDNTSSLSRILVIVFHNFLLFCLGCVVTPGVVFYGLAVSKPWMEKRQKKVRDCLRGGGGPQVEGVTRSDRVNRLSILPILRGLAHLPSVPHAQVNRP